MEKQKFYEKRKHGTPRFPMECFVTRADGNQHFLVPLHWHRNIEIMQMLHGTAVITIGNETFSAVEGDIFCINQEELHRIVSEDNQLVYRTGIDFFRKRCCSDLLGTNCTRGTAVSGTSYQ